MKTVSVTVPGKMMLSGEYAVLDGARALAFTINRFLTVNAATQDNTFTFESDYWPESVEIAAAKLPEDHEEPFVDTMCQIQKQRPISGARFKITSELDTRYGLGSSSALRLGLNLAISALQSADEQNPWSDATAAFEQQQQFQKQGSGYDVATQTQGGIVEMRPKAAQWPGMLISHNQYITALQDLVHVYVGGRGAPTSATTQSTSQWLKDHHLDTDLFALSEELTTAFLDLFADTESEARLKTLCQLNKRHREVFRASPHFPIHIAHRLQSIAGCDQTWTFKTTGAGGEDAILLIGWPHSLYAAEQAMREMGWEKLSFKVATDGAVVKQESGR